MPDLLIEMKPGMIGNKEMGVGNSRKEYFSVRACRCYSLPISLLVYLKKGFSL